MHLVMWLLIAHHHHWATSINRNSSASGSDHSAREAEVSVGASKIYPSPTVWAVAHFSPFLGMLVRSCWGWPVLFALVSIMHVGCAGICGGICWASNHAGIHCGGIRTRASIAVVFA